MQLPLLKWARPRRCVASTMWHLSAAGHILFPKDDLVANFSTAFLKNNICSWYSIVLNSKMAKYVVESYSFFHGKPLMQPLYSRAAWSEDVRWNFAASLFKNGLCRINASNCYIDDNIIMIIQNPVCIYFVLRGRDHEMPSTVFSYKKIFGDFLHFASLPSVIGGLSRI